MDELDGRVRTARPVLTDQGAGRLPYAAHGGDSESGDAGHWSRMPGYADGYAGRDADTEVTNISSASSVSLSLCQPQPSSWRRSSSMPKWCATSWTTVTATSSTTSCAVSQ
ncbi:hypothetical protein GCM10010344_61890 [Streptomyces bluensis]|nr:hypothetical protein GCM10010344_61890 [Streptomyces bluensis]